MPLLRRKGTAPSAVATADAQLKLHAERSASGENPRAGHPRIENPRIRPTPGLPAATSAGTRLKLLQTCANPGCTSGWLHLLRSRAAPIFEGGWSCSAACTAAMIGAALRRESDGRGSALENHRHRIPLGLVMLEQGWITATQLRQALEAQRVAGGGRLGHWLVRRQGVGEQLVARALGLQWSCPVLPLEFHRGEGLTALMPRLFVDAFGALPLRVAAARLVYLGFEDRLDPALALAVERMTGLRVESGLVEESRFRESHARMLNLKYPSVELIEAVSESALASAFARAIERARPAESRLVRVHDCFWLRMWRGPQRGPLPQIGEVSDSIGSMRIQ